ncbi:secreted RxLR effector protein 161-like [Nicotiana sylvestris]|uniref:secreted RxLR effector protein 161-like n=1 Tax=Nicotiana sylvestris TaxID=4096 RepID=UPI00388C4B61
MNRSKEIDTPMATATKLDIDEPGSSVDQKLYSGMISSLLYLTARRPEIVFSIGLFACFQANPKEFHLTAVKRILRYLKGTTDLCLWYPKGSNFNIVGYADVDYTGFPMDRKSTSGMDHFLGSCLVSWATKKKNSAALSTAKAKHVVAASCCVQLLWIKQQLVDFGIEGRATRSRVKQSESDLQKTLAESKKKKLAKGKGKVTESSEVVEVE